MTTYPLSTLAFQVTPTGVSAPSYADIYASLQANFLSIYGSDSYIDPDSQDGQMLAVFAQAINDVNASGVAVYNSFSPIYAQGNGLSSNVKINGLTRLVASNSTGNITIIGQAGTIITNGIVGDGTYQWALPATVTIPIGGSIVETATCTTLGAVSAMANTITQIITPTRGWQTANNPAAATIGAPVETDAALRVRQISSTQIASQTILGGIIAAVANVSGVQAYKAFENDTSTTNGLGIPPHSISLVVQGGDAVQVATAIALKKSPGTGTYGTTTETIIDAHGIPDTINFFVPTQVTISVTVGLHPLVGYTSVIGSMVQQAIADYINGLGIYANNGLLSLTRVIAAAYNTGFADTYDITTLQMMRTGGSLAAADIAIAFNEIPIGSPSFVTISLV